MQMSSAGSDDTPLEKTLSLSAVASDNWQQQLRGLCGRVKDRVLADLVRQIDVFEHEVGNGRVAVGKLQSDSAALSEKVGCRHHRHFERVGFARLERLQLRVGVPRRKFLRQLLVEFAVRRLPPALADHPEARLYLPLFRRGLRELLRQFSR